MASDQEYMAFLDKANQPTGTAPPTQTKTASAGIPREGFHPMLERVDAYYTSESDEPFKPVSFDWENDKSLNISTFMELLSTDADVVSLTPKEFDPKGKYKQVLATVGEAGNGEIYVFKVDFGGTRLEYYVVSISKDGGQVQGLKALAVES